MADTDRAASTPDGRSLTTWVDAVRTGDSYFRYAALVALGELLVVFLATPPGLIVHALVLVACATRYLRDPTEPGSRALVVLALVPTARLLGLAMPLDEFPRWTWAALAGAPLLVGAVVMAWRIGMTPREIGLWWPSRPKLDAAVVAGGTLLGVVAHWLGASPVLLGPDSPAVAVGAALALAVFVALPEELIFRGLLQRVAGDAYGWAGIAVVPILYATMFLSSFSVAAVLVMGIAGLLFSWSLQNGGTLWGTIGAHAVLIVGAALIWPALLG